MKHLLTGGGLQTGPATLEINVMNLEQTKNKSTLWPNYINPWHILTGFNIPFHRQFLIHVPCSSIHNSQEMEQAKFS